MNTTREIKFESPTFARRIKGMLGVEQTVKVHTEHTLNSSCEGRRFKFYFTCCIHYSASFFDISSM